MYWRCKKVVEALALVQMVHVPPPDLNLPYHGAKPRFGAPTRYYGELPRSSNDGEETDGGSAAAGIRVRLARPPTPQLATAEHGEASSSAAASVASPQLGETQKSGGVLKTYLPKADHVRPLQLQNLRCLLLNGGLCRMINKPMIKGGRRKFSHA